MYECGCQTETYGRRRMSDRETDRLRKGDVRQAYRLKEEGIVTETDRPVDFGQGHSIDRQ